MISINHIVKHLPQNCYSNDELIQANEPLFETARQAGVRLPEFDETFWEYLGVERRHLYVDLDDPGAWWKAGKGRYPIAREAAASYVELMKDHPPLREDDRVVVISNTVDVAAPNMGYAMIAHLRRMLPDFEAPQVITLAGEGCSGYISGLREADIFLSSRPDARVVIVTAETLGSMLWNPISEGPALACGTPQMVVGLAIQRLLFGDGCTASLISRDGEGHRFSNFARWDNLDPNDVSLLENTHTGSQSGEPIPPFGFFQQQPRELMERLAGDYLPRALTKLSGIEQRPEKFAIHTGSLKILQLVKSGLGLAEKDLDASAAILRDHGNMNSSTGPMVLAAMPAGAPVFSLFFGLGFSLQAAW